MIYWTIVIMLSLITINYLDKLNKVNVSTVVTKGKISEKTFLSVKYLLIFTLPCIVFVILKFIFEYIFSIVIEFNSIELLFSTVTVTITIGMLCELVLLRKDNGYIFFNNILILVTILAFIIFPYFIVSEVNYNKVIIGTLILACMDTFMNIIGGKIVSKLPSNFPIFRYPKFISGNKTFLTVLLSLLCNVYLFLYFIDIDRFNVIDVIIISLLGVFGDGLYSAYKRLCEIDDFSNLLGKIGGFCDRFDSWIFPYVYIFISWYSE